MTGIVTRRHAMPLGLRRQLARLASRELPVLLGGEDGDPPAGVLRPGRARIFAVRSGVRRMLLAQDGRCREIALQPGTLCFIGPKGWHRSLNPGEHRCFKVIWDPAYTNLADDRGRTGISLDEWHSGRRIHPSAEHVIQALSRIAAGNGPTTGAPALLRGLLQLTLGDLDRACDEPGRELWQAVRDHLAGHFHEAIDRNEVARLFGVHPNHLSRLFRRIGGERFQDHLTRLRQHHAIALMDAGIRGNAELARRCGYASANYFASAFRRYHGCSPGAYTRFRQR